MPGAGLSFGMRAGITVILLVAGYLLFEFGRIQADYAIVERITAEREFRERISELQAEIEELKQEIALEKTHRDIEREAYQVVEENLAALEAKIQEQSDAIAFYRGIVSPQDGGRGLKVQDLKLTKGAEEGHYNLRLVLVQVMQHDRSVKGEVDFSLEGLQDGVATTYQFQELLPADSDSSWPFAFRYFQDFDRELVIPVGFAPEKINVEVVSRTKSIASIKQTFAWPAVQS
jgi:septal ring factor EnvC (AmiA/AmiB activator)